MTEHTYLATCPKGLGSLLIDELRVLGATAAREQPSGVAFTGPLAVGYRACLWSRLANRILLQLGEYAVASADDLYQAALALPWETQLAPTSTLMVDFSGHSEAIRNAQFGAQRVKDGIVDRFRARGLARPSVDLQRPDLRVSARLHRGRVVLSVDLSGDSLHRRDYRLDGGKAPLKENLACAVVLRAGWAEVLQRGGSLIDPMCGSGTLLIEAAMVALDWAPGLQRQRYGFQGWLPHQPAQWRALVAEAEGRRQEALPAGVEIRGYDGDIAAIRRAEENVGRLGLQRVVRLRSKSLATLTKPSHVAMQDGLLVCNPPWGERISQASALPLLYRQLGELFDREFRGWRAAVLTKPGPLGHAIGLRSHRQYPLHSGPIDLTLLLFDLGADNRLAPAPAPPSRTGASPWATAAIKHGSDIDNFDTDSVDADDFEKNGVEKDGFDNDGLEISTAPEVVELLTPGAEMLLNRLRKNQRRLQAWLQREQIEAYRLYDADMPEYALAVDVYAGIPHVAEYAAPKEIDEAAADRRMAEACAAVRAYFKLAPNAPMAIKQRQRQRGREQYRRQGHSGERFMVREGGVKVLVNLYDYLDTGLFLDHRPLRLRLAAEARGKHVLNLFCYTGVATLHAAVGGAVTSTSVDLSNTYLDWFRDNLAANGLSDRQHRAERGDVLTWLCAQDRHWDLILLDPPSFSNSKAMTDSFDVQRDHVELITAAMARLSPNGVLYFSNNRRRFKLAPEVATRWQVEDITAATLPPDFQRGAPAHACWRIQHLTSAQVPR